MSFVTLGRSRWGGLFSIGFDMSYANILGSLSTTNVADAHDHLNLVCKWLTRHLLPTSRARFWGEADVVQWGPTRKASNIRTPSPSTWDEVRSFVDLTGDSGRQRVYVSGCHSCSDEFVLVGGLSLTYLSQLGYAGAVINGRIRDHDELAALTLPIWSAGFGIMDSQGCMKVESRRQSCTVNDHLVMQGDLIFGDGNGVIAIGANDVDPVLERAAAISEIENEILQRVLSGANLLSIVDTGGHI